MPALQDTIINSLIFGDDLVILSLTIKGLQNKIDKLVENCDTGVPKINLRKQKLINKDF